LCGARNDGRKCRSVKFEGQPPFLLPEAKSAQADVFENSVVVTLYSDIFGAVLALGILAMAVAGFNAPGPDAAISASPKASNVVAADLKQRADRDGMDSKS
jgi:hypothetical protein